MFDNARNPYGWTYIVHKLIEAETETAAMAQLWFSIFD
jgi:hypothetical protein